MSDGRADRRAAKVVRGHAARIAGALVLAAGAAALAGCGGGATTTAGTESSVPGYVSEPFTHEQELIEQGARLAVADGCSACHLSAGAKRIAPSFAGLAGHTVALTDGRRVLVDERFLRAALRDPAGNALKGYDAALMNTVSKRLQLAGHPHEVEALAAFIEQIGPEPG